jgi:hypothetical protein
MPPRKPFALKFKNVISFVEYSSSELGELLWAIKTIVQNVKNMSEKKR